MALPDYRVINMKTGKLAELALLTALALIIFVVELRIPNPIPVPGVKLGLANVVTVYAVYHYRAGEVFAIVLARIILGAVFGGSIIALIYSFAGGMFCLLGMFILKKILSEKCIWLCSVFGAILHNIGQIITAVFITGTLLVLGYLPILLVAGCMAGAVTGICAQIIIRRGF